MKDKPWLIATLAGILLWGGVYALTHWIRSWQPTAETVVHYIDSNPLESMDQRSRDAFLLGLAGRMNKLEFEERRKLRMSREVGTLVRGMTEQERLQLFERTLPQGMNELMNALNKMTPEQRKRWVQRGQQQLQEAGERMQAGGQETAKVDEELARRVTQQGFQSYLENASSETKLDLAPLMEQIQLNLQGMGGR